MERGADVQAVNRCGKSPIDLAPQAMLPYLLEPHCIGKFGNLLFFPGFVELGQME